MKTIYLQVEDDFVETLLGMLPADKVRIINQQFIDDQKKLHEELENYISAQTEFTPYYESMKAIDKWVSEGEKE